MIELVYENIGIIFLLMLVGHALADYPLQGSFLSAAKNPNTAFDGIPWYIPLSNHAAIHGGMVGIITGVWWLGVLEAVSHWLIDLGKCNNLYSFTQDQIMHFVCKIIWVLIIMIWLV